MPEEDGEDSIDGGRGRESQREGMEENFGGRDGLGGRVSIEKDG